MIIMMKECVVCNKEFEGHHNRKYCDDDACKEIQRQKKIACKNAWRESKKPPIEDKTCLHCGEVFTPEIRNNVMYCDTPCRRIAHKEKLRQETKKRQAKIPLRECKACKEMFKPPKDDPRNQLCGYECNLTWSKMKSKKATKERQRNITPRVCVGCEKTFMPNRYDVGSKQMQVYCDGECGVNHARQLRLQATREKAELIEPRICVTCKNTFMPTKEDTGIRRKKYCDDKCSYNDPDKRIPKRMRNQLRKLLKTKTNKTFKLLPYNKGELVAHIKSLFNLPKWYGDRWVNDTGYSMDNINKWSIDHIRPIASFNQRDLNDPNSRDFKKCWALNNLQPLWHEVNYSKNSKWDGKINA